ncbi:MAG TPA: sugar phosphate nucleotidyltransferase [Kofleriaceae bacterium]|nr:sugar phosphate nucleotidyltransferase [Kofleriaceae bacterium]
MLERGRSLWSIVLAGGAGKRLASLTRALYGHELPKQFAVLTGRRSLLQATVDRATSLSPPERIAVVVSREHERLAREQLREWPGIHILVQPRNLDTGPGILLALDFVRRRDRAADVAVLPSDHHVTSPAALLDAIERARAALRIDPGTATLLGAEPDRADPDYGWIVAGRSLGRFGMHRVQHFVEKPPAPIAERLHRMGGLWNTFVMVATVEMLWASAAARLPVHAEAIRAGDIDGAYRTLSPAGFSREVLERTPALAVLRLAGAGWSDWGTPRRVFQSLAGTPDHDRLIARITAPRRQVAPEPALARVA